MDEQQQGAEVVIVGDDGTEHVFPAGFDPKRAAAIVRQAAPPKAPVDLEHRPDSQMFSIDRNWITDKASKLPTESARWYGAAAGSKLADVAEGLFGAPESVLMGAGALKPSALMPKELPVSYAATPIRDAIMQAGSIAEKAPGAGGLTKLMGRMVQKIPVGKTFQDLPLAQQMEHLPVPNEPPPSMMMRPAMGRMSEQSGNGLNPPLPMAGRQPIAPAQPGAGFNDLPLYQQMAHLPEQGGPITAGGRTASPPPSRLPLQVQGTAADELAASALSPTDAVHYKLLTQQGVTPSLALKIVQRKATASDLARGELMDRR